MGSRERVVMGLESRVVSAQVTKHFLLFFRFLLLDSFI